MRENAWHVRIPQAQHHQWFKNLVDLHEMTTVWLKETQAERPSHVLTRGLSAEIGENLWMLESLSTTHLEKLLDDTQVEDLLARLEKTIWVVQAWTLSSLRERARTKNIETLDTLLEQLSWKLGRATAENRWKSWSQRNRKADLQDVLLALNDSPLSGYPHTSGFLIKRSVGQEIQVEMKICPHQIFFPEVKIVADDLCKLHADWIRGFVYALNNRIFIENQMGVPKYARRCGQRWTYKQ